MISRFVRIQLVLFTVISVVSIGVIAVVYAQVPTMLGFGQRTLTAQFSDAAGLYEGARVTYRGVEIGRVTGVAVDGDGVEATMSVSKDHPVPDDSRAEVHSVSAIGEQYVDLVSGRTAGPYFADDANIPENRTSVPPGIGSVLDNANTLLASLPRDSLRTALNELSSAFNGTGEQLQRLLDQGTRLVDEAQQNFGPTQQLIDNAGPLLDTQVVSSDKIRSLVKSLSGFTDQVHASDADLRSLLDRGQPAAQQVNGLFQDLRPTLPILLSNMVNVEQVLVTYQPALETVLVVYPVTTTSLISTTKPHQGDGGIGLDLRLNVQNPPQCTTGFLPPDQRRDPSALTDVATPDDLRCKLPQNDPTVLRGSRNLPCLAVPGKRAATPAECGGEGYRPQAQNEPPFAPGTPLGALTGARYDPGSGTAVSADGQFFALGGIGTQAPRKEDLQWQRMLLSPVGL
ncbi:MCE family protein [Amycolatopsis acidicola]|uniref:MCE family protein n=1 Tax=Amycolatopsis acidicola TaxID=2596893 RepID=UPI0014092C7A|nr:MlaD family protein [Amycolatopsis acidicola]